MLFAKDITNFIMICVALERNSNEGKELKHVYSTKHLELSLSFCLCNLQNFATGSTGMLYELSQLPVLRLNAFS